MKEPAALGFRVKSGWALAVLLAGQPSSPTVMDRRRVELTDPNVPASIQPFHAGLDLPTAAASRTIARLVKCVERVSALSIGNLLTTYRDDGYRIVGAGIVAGSIIDPAAIKNDHIRAHAEEGRLFRVVIDGALRASRIRATVTPEKKLFASGVATLELPESRIRAELIALGRVVAGPWRAEEKAATLAAWIALADNVD